MGDVQILTVTVNEQGQRLDNFLLTRLKGVPKSALYRVIRRGEVRVNKGRVKPERRLVDGDQVRVPPLYIEPRPAPPGPGRSLIQMLQSAILYDQEGLLVINKPSGLAVHGGSGINLGMIEALRQLPGQQGFLELIHRLDRETSGCVMVARKRSVLTHFQHLLRERIGVQKTYIALVQGSWPRHGRVVEAPLKRFVTGSGERIVRVHEEGKPALTRFSIKQRFAEATLLEASPISGRTHQIRVHAKHMGCPLVGDEKYGDTPANTTLRAQGFHRLFLHAARLRVQLPSGEWVDIAAPMPADLALPLERFTSVASDDSVC